jgi:hypothetical protein
MKWEHTLAVVQALGEKPVCRAKELYGPAGSRASAYRVIHKLEELGLAAATPQRGFFTIRSSVQQPYNVWLRLIPSLRGLKQARYFGRVYDESDVEFAKKSLKGVVTLDYRAYELTKLREPRTFFIYLTEPRKAVATLVSARFRETAEGRVAILPREERNGGFENEIQRVYLDCLAFGGKCTLDAIAIELLYGDKLSVRGEFPVDLVLKVRAQLQSRKII